LRYDFQENSRIVEPYILGIYKDGNAKPGAYQFDKIECLEYWTTLLK